jgi:serine/threonine protein kinase
VAYEILNARLPFNNRLETQLLEDMRTGRYKFHEDISEEAKDFIGRCLRFDPLERPEAAELLQHPWFDQLK